jgi:UDP-N-acetylmuramoyl-tripeptide--D-alanyl-D-alanine ligase
VKETLKKIIVVLLQFEAKLVLKKYKPKIVAVTGSVGKTSTKDAIFTVLSTTFFVRKSSKSFNSEIGVPLTILGLPNAWNSPVGWLKNLFDGIALVLFPHKYPEWLVLEVGADRPGDIKSVAFWLKPEVSVITRLSDVPVHVEFFDSAEQVRLEKSQLVLATPKTGTVVLNGDDRLVSSLRPMAKGRVLTYGTKNGSQVVGRDFGFLYPPTPVDTAAPVPATATAFPVGIYFTADIAGEQVMVEIEGALGRQQMYSALAALSVGHALNVNLLKASEALRKHMAPPGRMNIIRGLNGSCIIDDTYNSSPVAATEALLTVKDIQAPGRKIAMFGDMLELGAHSRTEHEKLGKRTAEVAAEIYTVGPRSKWIYNAALEAGFDKDRIFWFDDSADAGLVLSERLQVGDVVLIKGSQGIRMEKAVAAVMAEPRRAAELLVRQEEEWAER